MQWNTAI